MIIPKEKRIIVYSVWKNEIINEHQKKDNSLKFSTDTNEVAKLRNECLSSMDNNTNLHSFVYVYNDGKLEKEINVEKPKFNFHPNYNGF